MLFALILFAEGGGLDPISGGAGWVGAGLLGAVLGWLLLWHLPSKDKLMREMITDCDRHVKNVTESFLVQLETQRRDFQSTTKYLDEQHGKHVMTLAEAVRQELRGAGHGRENKVSERGSR